jgi:hypothetical protein
MTDLRDFFFFCWAPVAGTTVCTAAMFCLSYLPGFRSTHLYCQEPPCLQRCERPLTGKGGTMGEKWPVILPTNGEFHAIWRDLLHTTNLRRGTDSFTSPPKEGMLRIFSQWKIWRLWPGSNPWTWVLEASMLPPDHRSHLTYGTSYRQQTYRLHHASTTCNWNPPEQLH